MPHPKPLAPLTDEEKRFAEENHSLIYAFLRDYRYDCTEFYDIAAIGFVRAIINRRDNQDLQFSTMAYYWMRSEVSHYFGEKMCEKRGSGSTDVSLEEFYSLGNSYNDYDQVIVIADLERAMKRLSSQERDVLEMLLQGFTQTEIGQALGYTRSRAYQHVFSIRNKLKRALSAATEQSACV